MLRVSVISLSSFLAFAVHLSVGAYVLVQGSASPRNRVCFLMCAALALWSFTGVFGFVAEEPNTLERWYKIATFGFVPYFALNLHFCFVLTGEDPRTVRIAMPVLYAFAALFVMRNLTGTLVYSGFELVDGRWVFTVADGSPWLFGYMAYFVLCLVASLAVLVRRYRKATTRREKLQSLVLIVALALSLSFNTVEELVLPMVSEYRSAGTAPVFSVIWTVGVAVAVVRFRFLSPSAILVWREIVDSIDEVVLLLDRSLRPVFVNRAAGRLLAMERAENPALSQIVVEGAQLSRRLSRFFAGGATRGSYRAHLRSIDRGAVPMEVRASLVIDDLGDAVGVLLLGREVGGLSRLRADYGLTEREVEVASHVLGGLPYKQIADALNITERTVKAHVANICRKTNVRSRIELVRLFGPFSALP